MLYDGLAYGDCSYFNTLFVPTIPYFSLLVIFVIAFAAFAAAVVSYFLPF